MSGYAVVIGNFQRVYTGFDTREDARRWADVAEHTFLTENGRCGVTIVAESPRSEHWGFKVAVEVWAEDETDGAFEDHIAVVADSFDEAEREGLIRAEAKYPGRHIIVTGAQVRS